MQPHCHHLSFPSMKSLLKHSWNVMENLPTSPSLMSLSTDIASWVVKGANIKITSTYSYMHRNLTWLDKTRTFTLWEGFKDQGCMSCPYNVWDHPHFHKRSSCSLIIIILHSHHWNLCRNSLEMWWNIFKQSHHQCHYPPTSYFERWKEPALKFLQLVLVCVEIWHG